MATLGAFNGTLMGLYIDGTLLGCSTSFDLNINAAEIDTTCKDSAGDKAILPGLRDWSVSADGVMTLDGATSAEYLHGLITARTEINIKMSTDTSGDGYWHGEGYITNLTITAPMEDKVTFSCSFVGNGALSLSDKT